jgi:hypothetical protein
MSQSNSKAYDASEWRKLASQHEQLDTINLSAQMVRQMLLSDLENTFKALSGYQNLEQYIADIRTMRATMVRTLFTPEMIEGLARQLKPLLEAAAEHARQHKMVLAAFSAMTPPLPKFRINENMKGRIKHLLQRLQQQEIPDNIPTIG